MKTLLFAIFIFQPFFLVSQNIIRVNSDPMADADYTDLNIAIGAANAGDIIHVEGSATVYGSSFTINKRLNIIGPGYFLGANPQTQAILATTLISGITFAAGSEGSVVMGCTLLNLIISTNNISLIRNYILDIININGTISNCVFKQNFIFGGIYSNLYVANSGFIIQNNFIGNSINYINNADIQYNVFPNGGLDAVNSQILNNIFYGDMSSTTQTLDNNNFDYNVVTYTLPTSDIYYAYGTHNIQNANYNYIFINSGSADGRYQLATGSPAIGVGVGGTDCGMFGGPYPYILSGLPPIPSIYELNVPISGSSSGGLNITIKAKSRP